jgi:hypothetical protein
MRLRSLSLITASLMFHFVTARCQGPPSPDTSLIQPLEAFDPAHQKPLSYKDASVRATLRIGRAGDSLSILQLATKSHKIVPLPAEMAQVDDIRRVAGNKILVMGMVNGSGSEIVLIDLQTQREIDKFVCYRPSVSPNGNFIAFIKFYPSHFAEGTEAHYMLYDLRQKPEDNRPKGVPSDDWQNVGRGVYHIGIGNSVGDNIGRPEGSQHESASRFFWNSDSTQFLFADRIDLGPEINFTLVDIAPEGDIKVRMARQVVDQFCSKSGGPQTVRSCLLLVRKVEFHVSSEAAFTITLEIVDLHRLKSFDLDSSQFSPGA